MTANRFVYKKVYLNKHFSIFYVANKKAVAKLLLVKYLMGLDPNLTFCTIKESDQLMKSLTELSDSLYCSGFF